MAQKKKNATKKTTTKKNTPQKGIVINKQLSAIILFAV